MRYAGRVAARGIPAVATLALLLAGCSAGPGRSSGPGGDGGTGGSSHTGGSGGAPVPATGGAIGTTRDASVPEDARLDQPDARPAGADLAVMPGSGGTTGQKTACLNAVGPGNADTYALIESVLGPTAIDNPPDNLHMPPMRHFKEAMDGVVGPYFMAIIHRDIDLDHLKNDRQRVEITIHAPGPDLLRGHDGLTLTYTWRFKLAPNLKTSSAFNIFFQLKSEGGNASLPIIALVAHNDALEIHHVDNGNNSRTVAGTSFAAARDQWLEAYARATFSHDGSFVMTVKKPDGTTLLKADLPRADMWRDGDFTKPKWGIYRSLNDKGSLNATEDWMGLANIGITPGGATPDSDCRNGK